MLIKVKKYWIFVLLAFILGLGLFLRVYNIGNLLGFYYDQGRDALTVWNLWHEGKFFLTGPVTGLAGIFLGLSLNPLPSVQSSNSLCISIVRPSGPQLFPFSSMYSLRVAEDSVLSCTAARISF